MKKLIIKNICLSIIVVGLSIGCIRYNINAHTEQKEEVKVLTDTVKPKVKVLQNNLSFYEFEDFDYLDYVEVINNTESCTLLVKNKEEAYAPGKKTVEIEAIDSSGNTWSVYLFVNITSNEDWNNYVNSNTYNYAYRKLANDNLINTKGYADVNAFELAKSFVGMKGACNTVAQAFIDAYLGSGYDVLNTYPITLEEARPGDIIYYSNGGLGEQHYATYLGGSSALQGNINGTTVIGSVYMSHGSTPQFKRLVGLQ